MTDVLLFITALLLGYNIRWRREQEVKIIIKVDAKQAILDLEEAQKAMEKLKREMNF